MSARRARGRRPRERAPGACVAHSILSNKRHFSQFAAKMTFVGKLAWHFLRMFDISGSLEGLSGRKCPFCGPISPLRDCRSSNIRQKCHKLAKLPNVSQVGDAFGLVRRGCSAQGSCALRCRSPRAPQRSASRLASRIPHAAGALLRALRRRPLPPRSAHRVARRGRDGGSSRVVVTSTSRAPKSLASRTPRGASTGSGTSRPWGCGRANRRCISRARGR